MSPKEIKEKLNKDKYIKLKGGFYRIFQANESTIESSALLEQLKDEGKYNYWIATYDFKSKNPEFLVSNEVLPIYGNSEKYITKWFYKDYDIALRTALRDLKNIL